MGFRPLRSPGSPPLLGGDVPQALLSNGSTAGAAFLIFFGGGFSQDTHPVVLIQWGMSIFCSTVFLVSGGGSAFG